MKYILIVISLIGICQCWNYADQDAWVREAPDCGGKMQSPINIETSKAVPGFSQTVIFYNFEKSIRNTIQKSGFYHFLSYNTENSFGPDENSKLKVTINGKNFTASNGAIHWGANDEGSEHTIDGKAYAAELHVNLIDMSQMPPKFTNIAFFYELSNEDNSDLKPFLDTVSRLTTDKFSYASADFSVASLIGNLNNLEFYSYNGSWTFPFCSENVSWLVATQKTKISKNQLGLIRKITGTQECRRKVQPLNGRTVSFLSAF